MDQALRPGSRYRLRNKEIEIAVFCCSSLKSQMVAGEVWEPAAGSASEGQGVAAQCCRFRQMQWQHKGQEQGQGSRDLSGFLLLRLCAWSGTEVGGSHPTGLSGHQGSAQLCCQGILLTRSCKPERGVRLKLRCCFPSWQSQSLPYEFGLCCLHWVESGIQNTYLARLCDGQDWGKKEFLPLLKCSICCFAEGFFFPFCSSIFWCYNPKTPPPHIRSRQRCLQKH